MSESDVAISKKDSAVNNLTEDVQRVRKVVDMWMNADSLSDGLRYDLAEWLDTEPYKAEKDAALYAHFVETFQPTENPSEEAHRKWAELSAKLGLSV